MISPVVKRIGLFKRYIVTSFIEVRNREPLTVRHHEMDRDNVESSIWD